MNNLKTSKLLCSVAALSLMGLAGAYAQSTSSGSNRDQNAPSAPAGAAPANRSDSPARMNDTRAENTPAQNNTADTSKNAQSSTNTTDTNPSVHSSSPQKPGTSGPSSSSAQSTGSRPDQSRSSAQSAPGNAGTSQGTTTPSGNAATNQNPSGAVAPGNRTQSSRTEQSAPGQAAAGSMTLNAQQQTRIADVIGREKIAPETNVNVAVNIGAVVPGTVRLNPLPASIAEIVPTYRGYSYFVVRDEIVIVEPSTKKIVMVVPAGSRRSGAAMPAAKRVDLSTQQRTMIRERLVRQSPATTTVTKRRSFSVGDEVPTDVTLEEFPETIYHDVPTMRDYRFYRADQNVVIVDPTERRVLEVIE